MSNVANVMPKFGFCRLREYVKSESCRSTPCGYVANSELIMFMNFLSRGVFL